MQSNQHSPREREIKSVAAWNGGFEFSVLCFWANTKFPVYWKFPGRFSPFTRKFPSQPEFSPYLDGLVQKKRFFFLLARKLSTRHAAKMPCTHCPCFAYCNQQRCSWWLCAGHIFCLLRDLLRQFSARADRVLAPRLLLQGKFLCLHRQFPAKTHACVLHCAPTVLCQGVVLLIGSDYVSDLFRQFSASTAKVNAPRHLLQGKLQFSAAATGASPGETFLLEIQRNQFFK